MIVLPASINASFVLDIALLVMLLVVAGAIVRTRSLLAAIILFGIYSMISAVWLVVMDAPDVAFTEAVVGSGISTIVLLGAILLTRGETEKPNWRKLIAPTLVCIAIGSMLIYAAMGLPELGDAASPANAHVGRAYLERAPRDIGVPNMVTAVLASYRGLDTLGATAVIFAAGIGVALMLGFGPRSSLVSPPAQLGDHHVTLRVAAKLLIPLIALFALYVQFHGYLGAGGGFQAGVIMAVAIILHALVFGLRETMAAIPPRFARSVASMGVLLYAGVGIGCMINGGAFLDYDYLFPPEIEKQIPGWILGESAHAPHGGQHAGILLIEIGVLLIVTATMVTVFYGFAGRTVEDARREASR